MLITQAITPLRMIFWGGLLCVFDFAFSSTTSINGQTATGYRFDILNDLVGMLLITIGVDKLSRFDIGSSFRTSMQFVFVCSILNCLEAFAGHFVYPTPVVVEIVSNLLSLASLCGTAMFCWSMNSLSSAYSLHHSSKSWLTTLWLVTIIWVIPLGLLRLLVLGAYATGTSFHFDLGWFAIPVLLVFVVPLVHLFVSTSRMRYEAESISASFAP